MHGPNLPTLHAWQSNTALAAGVKSAYMLQLTMRLSPWTAVEALIAHMPAPQTICSGHRIRFHLTIRPEQPSLHGMTWKVPPLYITDAMSAYKRSLSGHTLQLPSR